MEYDYVLLFWMPEISSQQNQKIFHQQNLIVALLISYNNNQSIFRLFCSEITPGRSGPPLIYSKRNLIIVLHLPKKDNWRNY